MNYLVNGLYIVAFGLFILGLSGLTGPKTAVRGNCIAAAGMGIAVVATLIGARHRRDQLDPHRRRPCHRRRRSACRRPRRPR